MAKYLFIDYKIFWLLALVLFLEIGAAEKIVEGGEHILSDNRHCVNYDFESQQNGDRLTEYWLQDRYSEANAAKRQTYGLIPFPRVGRSSALWRREQMKRREGLIPFPRVGRSQEGQDKGKPLKEADDTSASWLSRSAHRDPQEEYQQIRYVEELMDPEFLRTVEQVMFMRHNQNALEEIMENEN